MKEKVKKQVFLWARIAISLGLITYIFFQIRAREGLGELPKYFTEANYFWLVGAVLLLLFLLWAGSYRWGLLLSAQGVKLSGASVFMYYMIGMFFNNFLPSTVGGDAVKAYYLSRATGKAAGSFISVLMDRLMGMTGLCVVAVAACLIGGKKLVQTPGTHDYALPIFLIIGGVTAGLMLFFLVVFNDRLFNFLLRRRKKERRNFNKTGTNKPLPAALTKIFRKIGGIFQKIGDTVRDLHKAVYIYKDHPGIMVKTALISTGIWVLIVLVAWMVYQTFHSPAAAGEPGYIHLIKLEYFYIFLPVIAVIMSIPISLAGLGTREVAFTIFFTTLPKISELDALVISLTFYFVYLTASLVGGVIYIFKDKLHFHREEIASPGEEEITRVNDETAAITGDKETASK